MLLHAFGNNSLHFSKAIVSHKMYVSPKKFNLVILGIKWDKMQPFYRRDLQFIFRYGNFSISLKFVPRLLIENKSALFEVMIWSRKDKPLPNQLWSSSSMLITVSIKNIGEQFVLYSDWSIEKTKIYEYFLDYPTFFGICSMQNYMMIGQ